MTNPGLEHYPSFICSQVQSVEGLESSAKKTVCRAVTISRQAGCGALVIAEKLAQYLQAHSADNACPWTVFDRNLIDKVLEDHNLPACLAKFLPEDRVSELEDLIADVFGVHPPSTTVLQQTAETILKLAGAGNVILIGRGANMVTASLPHMLHVRLVAPLEKRIEHTFQFYHDYNQTKDQARKFCLSEDAARQRYLKKYFNADIEDPLLYHMVINTGLVGYDDAARIIGDAVLKLG
ncbi:MAG: cytidylate kinase-like family protein [Verrucomicrobiota bacterium]|jgi:cytidylate kinase